MPAGTERRLWFMFWVWCLTPSAGHFITCPPAAVVVKSFELTAPWHRSWWEKCKSTLLLLCFTHSCWLGFCHYWFQWSSVVQVCKRGTIHEAASWQPCFAAKPWPKPWSQGVRLGTFICWFCPTISFAYRIFLIYVWALAVFREPCSSLAPAPSQIHVSERNCVISASLRSSGCFQSGYAERFYRSIVPSPAAPATRMSVIRKDLQWQHFNSAAILVWY